MDRYQSDFKKLDNFFSGKEQAAVKTGQEIYSLYIYNFFYDFLSKDFQSSCITFIIFNNLTQQKTNEKHQWILLNIIIKFGSCIYSNRGYYKFCVLFFFFWVVVYIIQLQLFVMQIFLHIVAVTFFYLLMLQSTTLADF